MRPASCLCQDGLSAAHRGIKRTSKLGELRALSTPGSDPGPLPHITPLVHVPSGRLLRRPRENKDVNKLPPTWQGTLGCQWGTTRLQLEVFIVPKGLSVGEDTSTLACMCDFCCSRLLLRHVQDHGERGEGKEPAHETEPEIPGCGVHNLGVI